MGLLDNEIENYSYKLEQLRIAKAEIEAIGLMPNLPAISISTKIVVLLTDRVDVSKKKNAEGKEQLIIRIIGYSNNSKDGGWYNIHDLVPYTDAARILYLK